MIRLCDTLHRLLQGPYLLVLIIAVQSANRENVAHVRKLAEGGIYRVLLLTMDDVVEVIVKIPYSIAVPKQLATDSEVATLDLLRSKGIPVSTSGCMVFPHAKMTWGWSILSRRRPSEFP
ncbi:hypothetical protein PAAG_11942 [Paracoccidioides lutzii Pb01]|uniref:Uncharacterized protein n=1 Tax=Paracoccidioides lutzii (strain ATCC MYA-826 / Pb01) TaxID=502779 RepID=A0A0A2VKE5_PARBA|nr:hypothetical protein PAAG_11942 [Paracoccidioides lutzii Pb01]KGQ01364.1 hypothetical protein PAAG_11942 [Paracoccidioides lutzii Pb01]